MMTCVVLIDSPLALGACAGERVDLALGALAMDWHVVVLLHGSAVAWPAQQPQALGLRSALKRLAQVPLYGGEVWLQGDADSRQVLPEGFVRKTPAQVAVLLRQAEQVLA